MNNKTATILAIDDNQDNLVVLKVLLSETFPMASLFTAQSGVEGIELCKSMKPDVVLLDIAMPVMDGYEVCAALKSDNQISHIPVIMLTATAVNARSRIRAMEAGADAFLSKPIDESELTAQIRAMLRIKESEDQKISEKERLEILVQQRTIELERELNEHKKTEKELQQTVDELNKSRGSEFSLLNDLRSEILVRKNAEEKVLGHLVDQRIISEFSRALVLIKSKDEIYEYVGRRIYEVAGDAFVLVVKYDFEGHAIRISRTFGLGDMIEKIKKATGFDALNFQVSIAEISEEEKEIYYYTKQLIRLPENALYTLSAHKVNKKICQSIELMAGIKSVYSIGFTWEDQLYGGVAILCKYDTDFKQISLVENLVNLASVALQRLYAEERLQWEHDNLNAILSSSPVGMLVIDENEQVVTANPSACRLFNLDLHQIQQRRCGDFVGCINSSENEKVCSYSAMCHACDILASIRSALLSQQNIHDQESEIIDQSHEGISPIWVQYSIEPLILNGKKHIILSLNDITQRKLAEEATRKTEKRYKSLIENAPDGIVLIGIDGTYKFASNSALRIFGYQPDDVYDLNPNQLTHPDDLPMVLGVLNDLIQNPSTVKTLEYRFQKKDGSWRWIQSTFSNLLSDTNVEAIVINFHDITERIEAEESVKESETKYRELFEANKDGIFILYINPDNTPGKIIEVNKAASEMLGYTRDEFLNFTPSDLEVNEKSMSLQQMEHEIREKGFASIESKIRHKNGNLVDIELLVILIHYNNSIALMNIARDITKRKQDEQALKESQQQLLDIIDFLPDATFVIDNDKKVIAWNKAMEEMTGVSKLDMIGQGDHAYTIPFYGKRQMQLLDLIELPDNELKARYSNFYRKGDSIYAEIFAPELYNRQGAFISNIGAPMYNSKGNRIGSIESIRDISFIKKAETALKESEEKYRSMVDLLPDAVFIHDGENVLFANAATCKLIGVDSLDQVPGKTIFDFVHPDYRSTARKRIKEVFLSGKPVEFQEFKFMDIKGDVIDVESIGIPVTFMGKPAIQSIARDITARKLAEKEILLKDELLHLTGEMAKVGGWEFDVKTNKGTWTDEALRIFDIEPESIKGIDFESNFFKDESLLKIRKAVKAAVEKGIPYDMELKITSAKGLKKWIRTLGIPEMSGNNTSKLRGIYQDITSRKEAGIILENERKRLRTLIETIPDLIWLKDPDGKYLFCNPKYEHFWGTSESEILGKTDFDLKTTEIAEVFKKQDENVLTSGNSAIYQEWLTSHTTGQKRLLNAIKTPMYDSGGKLIGVLGVSRDITEVHQSQEKLREREEIFSAIVNQANDAIVMVDINTGELLEYNEAAFTGLGYTSKEFKKLTLFDIEEAIKPDKLLLFLQDLKQAGSKVFETKHRTKNNEIKDVRVSSRVINIRGEDYLTTIWTDITEKNRNEALLREKDLVFQSLLDYSPFYIFFKDHNSKAIHLSRNYELLLDKPVREMIGKDLNELFSPEYGTPLLAMEKQIMTNGKQIEYEEFINGKYYMTIKFPILRKNAPPMLAGFTIDITDRKVAEQEIIKLNSGLEQRVNQRTIQLEHANKELEAFSYSVSHDLRAPLRGIDGWSLALLEDNGDQIDSQGHIYLKRVRDEAQRMGHLIDDLLKLSRVSRFEIKHEEVNLSSIAQTIVNRLTEANPQRQFEFTIHPDISVTGDPAMLEIVLTNLLDNAVKFTGHKPFAQIEFGATVVEGEQVYYLSDNGAGFDMENAKNLFGAFQRMHKQTEFQGTGVGLATVQRIIHRHGGKIWAESQSERGTTFYFTVNVMG